MGSFLAVLIGVIWEASGAVFGRRKPEKARKLEHFKHVRNNNVFCLLRRLIGGPPGALLGRTEASWEHLGSSWRSRGLWVSLGALLGLSWGPLGALGKPSWGSLGPLLGCFGALLGRPGALWKASWAVLGRGEGRWGRLEWSGTRTGEKAKIIETLKISLASLN